MLPQTGQYYYFFPSWSVCCLILTDFPKTFKSVLSHSPFVTGYIIVSTKKLTRTKHTVHESLS